MKITSLITILFLSVITTPVFAVSKQEKCHSIAEIITSSATDGVDAKSAQNQQLQLENNCMSKPDEAVNQIYRDTLQLKKETN